MTIGMQYISKKELANRFNRHISTINLWIRQGVIPEPRKLSERRTLGWTPQQIENWLKASDSK